MLQQFKVRTLVRASSLPFIPTAPFLSHKERRRVGKDGWESASTSPTSITIAEQGKTQVLKYPITGGGSTF
jgi:hypothetical protein